MRIVTCGGGTRTVTSGRGWVTVVLRLRLLHADLGRGVPLSLLGLGLRLISAGRLPAVARRSRPAAQLAAAPRSELALALPSGHRLAPRSGLSLLLALLPGGWRLRALLALSGLEPARLVERGHELVELGDHVRQPS